MEVSQNTLKRQYKKMTMVSLEGEGEVSLPFSQGYLIKEIVAKYHIIARKVGYFGYYVCIETKNQLLFWYDTGIGADFKGIVNKEARA